jgi:hypothetical protein
MDRSRLGRRLLQRVNPSRGSGRHPEGDGRHRKGIGQYLKGSIAAALLSLLCSMMFPLVAGAQQTLSGPAGSNFGAAVAAWQDGSEQFLVVGAPDAPSLLGSFPQGGQATDDNIWR